MDDPKAMARWAKEMGRTMADETGEELSGDFDEMMEAAAPMPKETTTKHTSPVSFARNVYALISFIKPAACAPAVEN